MLFGMDVRESLHAVTAEQLRKHEKKPGQSESYHKRINKKWRKRFGMTQIPCMYKIGAQYTGTGREALVVHPDLMPKLLESVRSLP